MQYLAKKDIRLHGRHIRRGTVVDMPSLPPILADDFEAVGCAALDLTAHLAGGDELPDAPPAPVAVVVSCYAGHLSCLPGQIAAVDAQTTPPAQKILALDNCDYCPTPAGWEVIHGTWDGPNGGRNAALEQITAEWVIFADADDEMDARYVDAMGRMAAAAGRQIGLIYADIDRRGTITTMPQVLTLRDQFTTNHVSASSCWRAHAIREAGGWLVPNDRYDDWTLANRLMVRSWAAVRQGVVPIRCYPPQHANLEHRSDCEHVINKWQHKTYTIVTLLAGREPCLQPWLDWLRNEDMPAHVKLLVVDNSHNEAFRAKVVAELATFTKFESVEFRRCGLRIEDAKNRWGEWGERHVHVSRIYTETLPSLATDFTMFLEDDVIPQAGAFRRLVDAMNCQSHLGGISGVYDSRNPGVIVGASHGEFWSNSYKRSDLPESGMHDAGFIAGGFSLWRTGVVLGALPLAWDSYQGHLRGWDTLLSLRTRQQGYRLQICCDVHCDHMTDADKQTMEASNEPDRRVPAEKPAVVSGQGDAGDPAKPKTAGAGRAGGRKRRAPRPKQ